MSGERPVETFQVRDERKPGHHWADNEVLDVHGKYIGAYGYAIYMAMSRFSSNRTGECSKSQGELAELLGLSKDTVQRYEEKLRERMLIHKRQVKGKPCVYILLEVAKAYSTTKMGEGGAKELPLTAATSPQNQPLAAAGSGGDVPPTAVCGKSDIPPTAATMPPKAATLPLTAAANKETVLSSKLNKTKSNTPGGALTAQQVQGWLAIKQDLEKQLPAEAWVRASRLFRVMSGNVLLVALPAAGAIIEAAKKHKERLDALARVHGFGGAVLTAYPDEWEREQLAERFGIGPRVSQEAAL